MAVDVFVSDGPVDVHVKGETFEVVVSSDDLDIHVGLDGPTGKDGKPGPPGPPVDTTNLAINGGFA
jgi:hypothetical protein